MRFRYDTFVYIYIYWLIIMWLIIMFIFMILGIYGKNPFGFGFFFPVIKTYTYEFNILYICFILMEGILLVLDFSSHLRF